MFSSTSFSIPKVEDDDVVMLLPTSGTSGLSKLTIVTNGMFKCSVSVSKFARLVVLFSYEPIRQSLDTLSKGGRIGLYSGSLDRMSQDILVLRPTLFGATPTFWYGLYRQYQAEVDALKAGNTNKRAVIAAIASERD